MHGTPFPIDDVRARFPYLAQCTYLNTASTGLAAPGQAEALAEFYGQDLARGYNGQERWQARSSATRAELATMLSVEPGSIEFMHSTTEALNLVALGLPIRPGESVAIAADEFPSVRLPWRTLVARGVTVIEVPIASEDERTASLVGAVKRGVQALAVSHVHWRTGTRVDLVALGAACRASGCWLIVDGAHGVGAVPVDASGIDAFCAPTFKWLLSGFGLGFLSLSPRLAAQLTPPLRGYDNEPPSRSLTYSHENYPGIYALHAALAYLRGLGWTAVHARVDRLGQQLISGLRALGQDVITPEVARAGIVAVRHPRTAELVRALALRSIHVEDRDGVVRVAPHFYNTEQEVAAFIAALDELAPVRRR